MSGASGEPETGGSRKPPSLSRPPSRMATGCAILWNEPGSRRLASNGEGLLLDGDTSKMLDTALESGLPQSSMNDSKNPKRCQSIEGRDISHNKRQNRAAQRVRWEERPPWDPHALNERLGQVETWWNALLQANAAATEKRAQARAFVVESYEGVARRYLTRAVGVEAGAVLSQAIGKPITGGWLRKKLLRARERFTELLLEEVARSVNPPMIERVIDELVDLHLLEYCRACLKSLAGR